MDKTVKYGIALTIGAVALSAVGFIPFLGVAALYWSTALFSDKEHETWKRIR